MVSTVADLKTAAEVTEWTAARLVGDDAEWAPDFALDDGTGQALVRPSGHVRFDLADAEPPPGAADHVDAFRERYGHERASFFAGFHGAVRYRETVIEVGQPVLVAGTAAVSSRLDANDERTWARETGIRAASRHHRRFTRPTRSSAP